MRCKESGDKKVVTRMNGCRNSNITVRIISTNSVVAGVELNSFVICEDDEGLRR